jgi:hypothetical protein
VRARMSDANLPRPTQVHLVSSIKGMGIKRLLVSLIDLVRLSPSCDNELGFGTTSRDRTERINDGLLSQKRAFFSLERGRKAFLWVWLIADASRVGGIVVHFCGC